MARRRDPKASREAIELAAAELFAEQGFAGTSTSQIAKKAGVAEGTIFRHFPTKKKLLLGVVGPLVSRFLAPVATRSLQELFDRTYPDLTTFLETLWDDRMELVASHPRIVRILVQEMSLHPEIVEFVSGVFAERVVPPFVAQVRRLQADGYVEPTLPPDVVVQHVVTNFGGTLALRHVFGIDTGRPSNRERDQLIGLLVAALGPRTA